MEVTEKGMGVFVTALAGATTFFPTGQPTNPTKQPTNLPSSPSVAPSACPILIPSSSPSFTPHAPPSTVPSYSLSSIPSRVPSIVPIDPTSQLPGQPTILSPTLFGFGVKISDEVILNSGKAILIDYLRDAKRGHSDQFPRLSP
jgi:hypothetical protein